ncbi:ATP-binding protein [Sulfurimonas sp. SAG-AH-194-C21]|nr:HP0729 family protein [Sulfurimonas sp. SAG-AH-194-C21]MDF1882624.1 ATP-binding protein [Sulfurimonas sp. SAG-AH-194-C21]
MSNLLTLYNPYYNKNVIEQHLELLKENGIVAFGKVRSKLRDYAHPHQDILDGIYTDTSREMPTQLFLTDYNSIYVANVISINKDIKFIKVPKYYEELEVEYWFVFDDLRLIAHKDFELIRDNIISNFKATNFNNRTYAIYGNEYVYPMQVTMKEEINYFEKDDSSFKFYTNIFKSEEQLVMKKNLIEYNFGKNIFYNLAPNSQDNIISAEIEYLQNKNNPLYDFSSVIVKYSKAVELELYLFMRTIFAGLMEKEKRLSKVAYSVQGRDYVLKDILTKKVNYGTYGYLLRNYEIKDAIHSKGYESNLKYFILTEIPHFIRTMQNVRNESVHGDTTTLEKCEEIRDVVIGIGRSGILVEFGRYLKFL